MELGSTTYKIKCIGYQYIFDYDPTTQAQFIYWVYIIKQQCL